MGNVTNLRQARKQKIRADKRETSAITTAVTNVKKPERTRVIRMNDMVDRALNGHKREDET